MKGSSYEFVGSKALAEADGDETENGGREDK